MKRVTVADLKDQIGQPGPHPFLWCPKCGEKNSANKGDYFMAKDTHVFRHCGRNMQLMTERTYLIPVTP